MMGSQGTDFGLGLRSRSRGFRGQAGAAARMLAPVGVIALGLVVLIVDGNSVSWLAGLLAGTGAGAWLALRRVGGQAAGRSTEAARAERRTEAAVASLERSGWRFLHDVRGSDGIYDHIAVGPGGVIVLQSISPEGIVTLRSGQPTLERPHAPGVEPRLERLRPRAVADAGAFRDDMQRLTGRRLWVQAVVVCWSEFPAGCVTDGRCVFIHGPRLAEWITRRPHQLDPADADDVFEAVQLLARSAGDLALPLAV